MSGDPTVTVDLAEPCPLWRDRLRDLDALGATAARAAVTAAGVALDGAELSLVLGDDALVRDLNRRWRGQDKATNVLSFSGLDEAPGSSPSSRSNPGAPRLLGDVVLAFETVAAEAAAQGKSLDHHLAHLIVHGVLHLLGHDHEDDAEAERMEALERAILAGLRIADPYRSAEPQLAEGANG